MKFNKNTLAVEIRTPAGSVEVSLSAAIGLVLRFPELAPDLIRAVKKNEPASEEEFTDAVREYFNCNSHDNKIGCIKMLRQMANDRGNDMGLREAKEFVEKVMRDFCIL